jgi:hypothetical protein
MASILQKPDKGGQIYDLKVSTRRGALQFIVVSACGLLPSLVFIDDLFDSAIIVTSDIIGVAFVSKA